MSISTLSVIPEANLSGQVNLNELKCDNHNPIAHQFLAIPLNNESHDGLLNEIAFGLTLSDLDGVKVASGPLNIMQKMHD